MSKVDLSVFSVPWGGIDFFLWVQSLERADFLNAALFAIVRIDV